VPPPQVHAPAAEQPSAVTRSQPTQAALPVPQVAIAGGLHVAPEQHPPGQVVGLQPLQRPPSHVSPAGHTSQAPPPTPHDAGLALVWQVPCAQQPVGHEVPSQTQVLPMQRWPTAHAGPPPQRQPPPDEQLSARRSQAVQVEPASPHVASDRVSQVVPSQQPLGHEVASQTHRPPAQRWPPAQAAPAPQRQLPSWPHKSDLPGSQVAHAAPPFPQLASERALHVVPSQQPPAHEVASQTHAPFMQRWPSWQGGPPPQRQAPVTEQVSAVAGSQLLQAAAPVPQVLAERG
jgi:hypothetical protein